MIEFGKSYRSGPFDDETMEPLNRTWLAGLLEPHLRQRGHDAFQAALRGYQQRNPDDSDATMVLAGDRSDRAGAG